VVAPLPESYLIATERCASRGLKWGVVYDALHLVEAERAGADVFLTFNPSDFERLAVGSKPRIVVPPRSAVRSARAVSDPRGAPTSRLRPALGRGQRCPRSTLAPLGTRRGV
jgi:hypothetical protein